MPGTRLSIRYAGSSRWAHFQVFLGTTLVASDGVHTETTVEHTVPAGSLRVVLRVGSKLVEEKIIETIAGVPGKVEFLID